MPKQKISTEALELGRRYVLHKARGPVTAQATGLSHPVIQQLYQEIHGSCPPGGPMPNKMDVFWRRRPKQRIGLQKFLNCYYRQVGGRMLINIWNRAIVDAYEAYLGISANDDPETIIDLTSAWKTAWAIVNRHIEVRHCKCCWAIHPWTIRPSIETCWICEQIERQTGVVRSANKLSQNLSRKESHTPQLFRATN